MSGIPPPPPPAAEGAVADAFAQAQQEPVRKRRRFDLAPQDAPDQTAAAAAPSPVNIDEIKQAAIAKALAAAKKIAPSSSAGGAMAATSPLAAGGSVAPPADDKFTCLPDMKKKDSNVPDGFVAKQVEINDSKNRHVLTRASWQKQTMEECGVTITTKGRFYTANSTIPDGEKPLYLEVFAKEEEAVNIAVARIQEVLDAPMMELAAGPGAERRQQLEKLEEKVFVEDCDEPVDGFSVIGKVLGPRGQYIKHIGMQTHTSVYLRGKGSKQAAAEPGASEPMHLHITGRRPEDVVAAVELANSLLETVKQQYKDAKARSDEMKKMIAEQQQNMPGPAVAGAPGMGGQAGPGGQMGMMNQGGGYRPGPHNQYQNGGYGRPHHHGQMPGFAPAGGGYFQQQRMQNQRGYNNQYAQNMQQQPQQAELAQGSSNGGEAASSAQQQQGSGDNSSSGGYDYKAYYKWYHDYLNYYGQPPPGAVPPPTDAEGRPVDASSGSSTTAAAEQTATDQSNGASNDTAAGESSGSAPSQS